MAKLYIITGPAGVGKSTISNEIAKLSNKSALIEGDEIYHQVVGGYVSAWLPGNHLDMFWKVSLKTIETYLNDGYDVVFNYIIGSKDLSRFDIFNDYEKKFVVLITDEKTIMERDKLRPEDCQMKERCIILLNSFKNDDYDNKYYLDTSKLSVEESVKKIEENNKYIF